MAAAVTDALFQMECEMASYRRRSTVKLSSFKMAALENMGGIEEEEEEEEEDEGDGKRRREAADGAALEIPDDDETSTKDGDEGATQAVAAAPPPATPEHRRHRRRGSFSGTAEEGEGGYKSRSTAIAAEAEAEDRNGESEERDGGGGGGDDDPAMMLSRAELSQLLFQSRRSFGGRLDDVDDESGGGSGGGAAAAAKGTVQMHAPAAAEPAPSRPQTEDQQAEAPPRPVEQRAATATSHPRNAGPYTVVSFVNSSSGGGTGELIFDDLTKLFGADYVFDLKACSSSSDGNNTMPEDVLERFALDPDVRVLACGGDGTMGWIESSIDEVWRRILESSSSSRQLPAAATTIRVEETEYRHHLPLAIIPLGTGNDLSRTLGWGGTYHRRSMSGPGLVERIRNAEVAALDRWRCVVVPLTRLDADARRWVPRMLGESVAAAASSSSDSSTEKTMTQPEIKRSANVRKQSVAQMERLFADLLPTSSEQGSQDKAGKEEQPKEQQPAAAAAVTESVATYGQIQQQVFDGVFCNYFSIGMDAEVAFLFHKWRENNPDKSTSPLVNKSVYLKNAPAALRAPLLRGKVRVVVKSSGASSSSATTTGGGQAELEELTVPENCRAVLILNIKSYGGGRKMVKGCRADDGLLEVVFLSHKNALSAVAAQHNPLFKKCKVAARTEYVCVRTMEALHCQVDGEPWRPGGGHLSDQLSVSAPSAAKRC